MWVFFFCRLFKISDSIHGSAYSNESELDSHIGSVKIVQTEMNKGKLRNYSSSRQKFQYSANVFTADNAFSASEIGEGMFKDHLFQFLASLMIFKVISCFFSSFYEYRLICISQHRGKCKNIVNVSRLSLCAITAVFFYYVALFSKLGCVLKYFIRCAKNIFNFALNKKLC